MNGDFVVGCLVGVAGVELEDVGVVFEVDAVGDVFVVKVDGVEEGGVGVVDF